MSAELPESIRALDEQLSALPPADATAGLMVRMLHIAVHGETWARPDSPRQVWLSLLGEVVALREAAGRS